ncbi:hypothetical protein F511_06996 [Dorcoceras hygrometricum]|uniref:Aminotransferase-like plant mobile domain-containing protein n=1 Tax=Dorcoceras hygrometricum TaxID=472368 RepID=A0A2Z7AQC7_9LAMI|nr:hypothetical protein F511_06996 [Dorcoceras hygrometricum]
MSFFFHRSGVGAVLPIEVIGPIDHPSYSDNPFPAAIQHRLFPIHSLPSSDLLLARPLLPHAVPEQFKSWPRVSSQWVEWVERLQPCFGEQWKSVGLWNLIEMSKVGMSRQSSLFDCMIRFWSPCSNAFLFPWGPMSPTLYDIHLFTGLPLIGPDSPYLINDSSAPKLAPPRYCFPLYRAVVKQYESYPDVPSVTEHIMFLWVLICQYLFCPISGKPSSEYLPLACSLSTGKVYNLGAMLLGSFYQGINSCVANNPLSKLGGIAWLLQVWTAAYFSKLFSFSTSSSSLSITSLMQGQLSLSAVDFLDFLQTKTFDDLTPPPKPHIGSFDHSWIATHPRLKDETKESVLDILLTACIHHRFLIVDCLGARSPVVATAKVGWSFEVYNPALFARQFGFLQIIPHSSFYYPVDIAHLASEIESGRFSRASIELLLSIPPLFLNPVRASSLEEEGSFQLWWAPRFASLVPPFRYPSGMR